VLPAVVQVVRLLVLDFAEQVGGGFSAGQSVEQSVAVFAVAPLLAKFSQWFRLGVSRSLSRGLDSSSGIGRACPSMLATTR
jgi:hypothetical protein